MTCEHEWIEWYTNSFTKMRECLTCRIVEEFASGVGWMKQD